MARGERFELNLDSDDEALPAQIPSQPLQDESTSAFIKDIAERQPTDNAPPEPPQLKASLTGFPEHRKRFGTSKLRQQRTPRDQSVSAQHGRSGHLQTQAVLAKDQNGFNRAERESIDKENRFKISNMSEIEIARERQELLAGLSGSLVQKLLKRANLDDGGDDIQTPFIKEGPSQGDSPGALPAQSSRDSKSQKKVSFSPSLTAQESPPTAFNLTNHDPDAPPLQPPPDLVAPSSVPPRKSSKPPIHFPSSPTPDLDPSSPSFFTDLHKKYFPSLPSDPSKLAWMSPLSTNEPSQAYDPAAASLAPADIRFDFAGSLLPPRLSHQLPTNLGLHHHGTAPEAAGYTIPELAILSRSTVAAQKCIAFQTLGRILHKLGVGVFGDANAEEGNQGRLLCRGLWELVKKERVLEMLISEAEKEGGNRTVNAMAVEAVWLWRQGGGRRDVQDVGNR